MPYDVAVKDLFVEIYCAFYLNLYNLLINTTWKKYNPYIVFIIY